MNKLALLTLSVLSTSVFANTYTLPGTTLANNPGLGANMYANEIATGLVNFRSANFRFSAPVRDSGNFISNFYSRESANEAEKAGKVERCENKSTIRGFRNYPLFKCFNKELFAKETKNYNDTMAYLRGLQTQIKLNEFTPSMAEIYVSVQSTGNVVAQASNTGSNVTHMGTARIFSCIDRQGKSHSILDNQSVVDRSNIEILIDELLDSGYEKYVRCHLVGSQLTATSLTTNSTSDVHMVTNRNYKLEISELSDDVVISNTFVYKGGQSSGDNDLDSEELNQAIDNYVDFIKFEYGLVLADIARDQLSEAEARLKVNRFLSENRGQIRELLSKVEEALNSAPLFTKVAAGFRVAQVYGMIKQIENSLNTQLTLDRIIRR